MSDPSQSRIGWWDKRHVRRDWPLFQRIVFEIGLAAVSLLIAVCIIIVASAGRHG